METRPLASVSLRLFSTQDELDLKMQQQHIQTLAAFFELDAEAALAEWTCYHNYFARHKNDEDSKILKDLLVSSVGDSFPQLAKLAGIILACPVGTAGLHNTLK